MTSRHPDRHRRRVTVAAALSLALFGFACSEISEPPTGESRGFVWTGSGEPTNFADDNAFCRRIVEMETVGSGAAGSQLSASQRAFWGCMRSRGWSLAGANPG